MTTRQTIDAAIGNALQAALPDMADLDRDAVLTADLGLDSVQIMGLVMEIEDELDLSIPVELLAEVRTLNQLAARLEPLVRDRKA